MNGSIDSAFVAQPASLNGTSFDSYFTTLWNNGRGMCYPDLSSTLKTDIGLKSFWCLNEENGAAFDAHGTNHCTVATTAYPTFTDGIAAGRASDGNFANTFTAASAQQFSLADNASLAMGDVDMWCAAWVLPASTVGADRIIMGQYDLASQRAWTLQYANTGNVWRFTVSPDGLSGSVGTASATTYGAPQLNNWQFVFAYHDSVNNTVNISVNGGPFDSASHSTGIFNSTSNFHIGAFISGGAPAAFFDGRIDGACFGKSPPGGIAAIATTIRDTLFNSGRGLKAAGVTSQQRTDWGGVSFWNLEESSGNAADSWGSNTLTPSASRPTRTQGVAYYEGIVSTLLDSGSALDNLTQGTIAKRPTLSTSVFSRGAISFDGVDDIIHFTLNNANPPSSATSGAWFGVIRFSALVQYATFASFADDDVNGNFLGFRLGGAAYNSTNRIEICEQVSGPQNAVNGNTVISANTAYLVGILSTGSAWRMRINGVEQVLSVGTGSNTGGWLSKGVSMDNIALGGLRRLSESEFANVLIAEPILLPSLPSASDIANIERYLNQRYGVY
jgi:hypothetical protein